MGEEQFDNPGEVGLDLINHREFGERPTSVSTEVIYAWHPVGAHGICFFLRVFATIAFDLYDEVKRILVAVVHFHDEIWSVSLVCRTHAIGHFKSEVVILDICTHARVTLSD